MGSLGMALPRAATSQWLWPKKAPGSQYRHATGCHAHGKSATRFGAGTHASVDFGSRLKQMVTTVGHQSYQICISTQFLVQGAAETKPWDQHPVYACWDRSDTA